jgi:hypothetical protein
MRSVLLASAEVKAIHAKGSSSLEITNAKYNIRVLSKDEKVTVRVRLQSLRKYIVHI